MDDTSKNKRIEILVRRAKVLTELDEVLAELASELARDNESGENPTGDLPKPDSTLNDKLARLPLAEACLVFLETRKEPASAKEIVVALLKAGRAFESPEPVRAVKDALKKALIKNKDIFHVGWARWHLRSKFSKAKLEKLLAANTTSGTGGRNPAEHGKRTRVGMRKAKAKGVQIGAKPKMTVQEITEAADLLGKRVSVADVAAKYKVSKPLIYTFFRLVRSKGVTTVSYREPALAQIRAATESAPDKKPELRIVK